MAEHRMDTSLERRLLFVGSTLLSSWETCVTRVRKNARAHVLPRLFEGHETTSPVSRRREREREGGSLIASLFHAPRDDSPTVEQTHLIKIALRLHVDPIKDTPEVPCEIRRPSRTPFLCYPPLLFANFVYRDSKLRALVAIDVFLRRLGFQASSCSNSVESGTIATVATSSRVFLPRISEIRL